MRVRIEPGGLERPEVQRLLEEHLQDMYATTPAESVHALDVSALQSSRIAFFTAWDGDRAVGCGALKDLGDGDLELKSMRTSGSARGRGVGAAVLAELLGEARRRGARRVLLETGAEEFFAPARRLYERYGFVVRGPFADYADDPLSCYMELVL